MDGTTWTSAIQNEAKGSSASSTVALDPGQSVSAKAIQQARTKGRLIHLIRRFEQFGFSHDREHISHLSVATRDFGEKFLELLPTKKALPKISPDGEGGLTMAWEECERALLVIVDGALLHAVIGAGTSQAQYVDDISFNTPAIPAAILNAIPDA